MRTYTSEWGGNEDAGLFVDERGETERREFPFDVFWEGKKTIPILCMAIIPLLCVSITSNRPKIGKYPATTFLALHIVVCFLITFVNVIGVS